MVHISELDTGPAEPAIVQQCLGDGTSKAPTRYLVDEVLLRRNWSLHRHVHLVRAFEQALTMGGIDTALSIGCGAGLSELFLAARHPDISFRLTDFDEHRLDIGRARCRDLHIDNVTFGSVDLLEDVEGGDRYDWVSSIEVLEHIDDDGVAARHQVELSDRWFWILVPQCSADDLADRRKIQRAWEHCGHHRPGYTAETLVDAIGADVEIEWLRSCYLMPSASSLRGEMKETPDQDLLLHRTELVEAACADLECPAAVPGDGIEVLGRVTRPSPTT